MRVLHVIGSMDCAGAETFLMNLYRNIDRDKIQFDFVVHTENHMFFEDEILGLGGKYTEHHNLKPIISSLTRNGGMILQTPSRL